MGYAFFTPVVQNESCGTTLQERQLYFTNNCRNLIENCNLTSELVKEGCGVVENLDSGLARSRGSNIVELTEDSDEDMFAVSDDSYEDPNYVPSDKDVGDVDAELIPNSDSESDEVNMSSESLQEMAKELEKNLSDAGVGQCSTKKEIKHKRNLGMEYFSKSGVVMARQVTKLDSCKRKCNSKITEDDQKVLFDQYWALGDYHLRQSFLTGLIGIEEKKPYG